jgi:FkbM family methyltransferase
LSRKEPGEIGSPDLSLRSRKGFYVDVGAYAPKQYSNTYAFYKKGWRGINIDATPGSMKAFRKVRKRDINIEAVISSRVGNVTLYSWGNPTVFNTISSEHAKKWELIVGKEPEKIPLRTITLEEILEIHIPPGQCIDFLSVDAESHDLEVLKSNNWTNHRPDVIAVEIDEEDIGKVLTDDIVTFMKSQRYRLRAWSGPTVFFEREGS